MKSLPEHEAFFQDLCGALGKHTHLNADVMLAIASNFVGKLIAMQDQRRMTPAMAMEIVSANIQIGNNQAVAELLKTEGKA